MRGTDWTDVAGTSGRGHGRGHVQCYGYPSGRGKPRLLEYCLREQVIGEVYSSLRVCILFTHALSYSFPLANLLSDHVPGVKFVFSDTFSSFKPRSLS